MGRSRRAPGKAQSRHSRIPARFACRGPNRSRRMPSPPPCTAFPRALAPLPRVVLSSYSQDVVAFGAPARDLHALRRAHGSGPAADDQGAERWQRLLRGAQTDARRTRPSRASQPAAVAAAPKTWHSVGPGRSLRRTLGYAGFRGGGSGSPTAPPAGPKERERKGEPVESAAAHACREDAQESYFPAPPPLARSAFWDI